MAMRSSSVALTPSFSHHSSMDGGPLFLPSTMLTGFWPDEIGGEGHVLERIILARQAHPAGDDAGFDFVELVADDRPVRAAA